MLRRILLGLILAGAVGAGIFWWLTIPAVVAPASLAAYTPNLANGVTTFNAGGCSSCHAVPNQPDRLKLGGGLAMPSPFGTPGKPMTGGYTVGVVARLCVSAEFRAFATNAHRPIADYLRALARDLNARTPGPGVGVIGMCFTGGFALAAAVDDAVIAPVLSQPSVPMPLGATRRRDPGLSEAELATVVARTTDANLCVLGLRFSEDNVAGRARFDTLRARLGDAFEVIELDSSPGNIGGFKKSAHSVLTAEVRDIPGNQALAARDRVVAFLRERLVPAS